MQPAAWIEWGVTLMTDGLILAPSIALIALWTVTLISDLRH